MRKKRHQKSKSPKPVFIVALLLTIILGLGWWVWRGLNPPSPRFNSLLISVNQESRNILPGETISLHSTDRVKILEISTNVFLNLNVHLVSEGFDVNSLQQQETRLSKLLPDQNIFDRYEFLVKTKYRDTELGQTKWAIQPYAEDWLDKAKRTIDDEKRIEVLKHGLAFLPEDSVLWRSLLDEYKAQKQWKQAADMLENAAEKDPNEAILTELLDVYAAMSSKTKISSVLEKLVRLNPTDLNLRMQLAEVLEQRGKYKSAIREYEELVKRVDKMDRLPIYKSLGFLYSKTGGNAKAISYYLKAAQSDKKDANIYYNLSYLYEKTKQKEKAAIYLEKAIGLNTKDLDSRLLLAQTLVDKNEFNKAEKYILDVLKKKPSSLKALLLKARVEEKKGNKTDLIKTYKKILSLDKKNETVLYNLGVLYYERGDLKSSLSFFSDYVKKNPKDTSAHGILFDIYKRQNNRKKAFAEAEIIVKIKPNRTDLYNYIFEYLKGQNAYEKIIPIMEQGLEANPKQTDLRDYLLFAYLKVGQHESALKQIKELLKARPKDIHLLLRMAEIFEKRNDTTQALETYKRVIEISPDNEQAEEAYLRLRLKGVRNR